MWNGFKVIDSDAHHHEPQYLWDRYVEPAYKDRVPRVIGMQRNFFVYAPDDKLFNVLERGAPIPAHHDKWMADKYGEAYDKWWSPDMRLKDMDRYGWDIQVILSTNANRIMETSVKDPGAGAAMARAYHNWCHEYASADSARLKFTATLPGGDPRSDGCGSAPRGGEARRRLGAESFFARRANGCTNPNTTPCGSWPAISTSRSRSMASRATCGPRPSGRCARETLFSALDHMIGFPMDNMVTMAHYIFSGVLERFPKLRLGILESNVGWANFWLPRMDDHSHGRRLILGAALADEAERVREAPMRDFRRPGRAGPGRVSSGLWVTITSSGTPTILTRTRRTRTRSCRGLRSSQSPPRANGKFSGTTRSGSTAPESWSARRRLSISFIRWFQTD